MSRPFALRAEQHTCCFTSVILLLLLLSSATFSGSGWSRGLLDGGGGAWIATATGMAMIEVNPALSLPSIFVMNVGRDSSAVDPYDS